MKSFLWRAWIPVAWVLPVLMAIHRWFFPDAGWEAIFFFVTGIIYIPALALLAVLPRFVLRRKGYTRAPASVAVMIIVHWWALVLFFLSVPMTGDSGSDPSPLSALFGPLIFDDQRAGSRLIVIAFFVSIAALIAAIVLAFTHKKQLADPAPTPSYPAPAPGSTPVQIPESAPLPAAVPAEVPAGLPAAAPAQVPAELPSPPRRRVRASVLAFVLTPLLLIGGVVGLAWGMMFGPSDRAGAQEADTAFASPSEMEPRIATNWDDLQRDTAALRERIGEDDWLVATGNVRTREGCEVPRMYKVLASWERYENGDPESVLAGVEGAVAAEGWTAKTGYEDGEFYSDYTSEDDDGGRPTDIVKNYQNAQGDWLTVQARLPLELYDPRAAVELDPHAKRTPAQRADGPIGWHQSVLKMSFVRGNFYDTRRGCEELYLQDEADPVVAERLFGENPETFRADEWPDFFDLDRDWYWFRGEIGRR